MKLILILHNEFTKNIEELVELRKNDWLRMYILLYNAVFNEILKRNELPDLKEILNK